MPKLKVKREFEHGVRTGIRLTLTPAVVVLNICIVIVLLLIVAFSVLYLMSDDGITLDGIIAGMKPAAAVTSAAAPESEPPQPGTIETWAEKTEPTESAETESTESSEAESSETTEEESTANMNAVGFDREFFANSLFIGDSIFTGLVNYDILPQKNVFAKIGLNPGSALTGDVEGESLSARIKRIQPEAVYIMLGTNGLAYLRTGDMIGGMENLLREISRDAAGARVYAISIPPVTKTHENKVTAARAAGAAVKGDSITNEDVNLYNAELKKAAAAAGVGYINTHDKLVDSGGYFDVNYAEQDGMHFRGPTYSVFLNEIKKQVESEVD